MISTEYKRLSGSQRNCSLVRALCYLKYILFTENIDIKTQITTQETKGRKSTFFLRFDYLSFISGAKLQLLLLFVCLFEKLGQIEIACNVSVSGKFGENFLKKCRY